MGGGTSSIAGSTDGGDESACRKLCFRCWPWGEQEAAEKDKGTSYGHLLDTTSKLYGNLEDENGMQDPFLLDDPELRHGKDQTVLSFPGWTVSVIPFVRDSVLKKELNEQFLL